MTWSNMSTLEVTPEDEAKQLLHQLRHVVDGYINDWKAGRITNDKIVFNRTIIDRAQRLVTAEVKTPHQDMSNSRHCTISRYFCDQLIELLDSSSHQMLGHTRTDQLRTVYKLLAMIDDGRKEQTIREIWAQFAGRPIM
jgi:hypothetical protein